MLIVFTCVHYRLVRLESSTTPQGMLVCFCGYSYPTLHCNISILRLSIAFCTKFQKLFCTYFTTHSTAAMRSFFMPGKIKVYVLKILLPSGTNKKGLCILPNPLIYQLFCWWFPMVHIMLYLIRYIKVHLLFSII